MASSSKGIHRLKLAATCVSIALNALCANGVLTFPLMAPGLAMRMKFTQPQLTSIVLAGMVGPYALSPLIGKTIDYYGPWLCSLIASVSFTFAYSLSAWEFATTPEDISSSSVGSFRRLVVCFAVLGIATGFSYFSALFAAAKNFPELIGIAAGFPNVMFGMSPLFLSLLASNFCTDPDNGLDIASFLGFLAVLCGLVNLLGAFTLHTPQLHVVEEPLSEPDLEPGSEPDETSALLPGTAKDITVVVIPVEEPSDGTLLDLVQDPSFLLLVLSLAIILGSCEMVISNIGTITLSLPPASSASSDAITTEVPVSEIAIATQVRLLAISNTVCRIVVGPLADYISPVACYLPNGTFCFSRKNRASRVLYLSTGALILALSFAWMEIGVRSQSTVWAFSVCVGMVNGGVFNMIPGILSSIWGLRNLGRNFGVVSYAPFIGTPIFSFLYSFVAESHSHGGVCKGVECWRLTFWINIGAVTLAFFLTIILWRQWRHRV